MSRDGKAYLLMMVAVATFGLLGLLSIKIKRNKEQQTIKEAEKMMLGIFENGVTQKPSPGATTIARAQVRAAIEREVDWAQMDADNGVRHTQVKPLLTPEQAEIKAAKETLTKETRIKKLLDQVICSEVRLNYWFPLDGNNPETIVLLDAFLDGHPELELVSGNGRLFFFREKPKP